jgi:hypothetical protein
LREGSQNLFGMRRHPNPTLCPVRGIELVVVVVVVKLYLKITR